MKIKELKKLIDNLDEKELNNEVYVSFLIQDKQKPIDLLKSIKELSYAAFLRTTAFGTEICATDKLD